MKEMTKFDEAIYILIVDLISKKERFGSKNVNLDEITESIKDNIRTSLNKLYLQQLIDVDKQKNIALKQKNIALKQKNIALKQKNIALSKKI